MIRRLISVCFGVILVCNIYGCAPTVEETSVAETEIAETDPTEIVSEEETESITDAAEQEEQAADSPMPQEEPEPEKEIDFDGSDTHRSILEEYERAWEDETYTVEEWQDVAGVFMTLTEAKFQGRSVENYTLYYSISDLSGDGTEELIIGIQGEDEIAPCFLYTDGGERIHMTSSRTESELVNIPTMLYENGIIESTDYVKNKFGIYRYNFYQLLKESGKIKLIDLYFYTTDSENGTQYYKGDMTNPITEEEFWNGIGDYESMPQIELEWNELQGFWKTGKDDAKTTEIWEEHGQSEKVEVAELKNDGLVTVMTKETEYYSDGSFKRQEEYEYDSAGNEVKSIEYGVNGTSWLEYEYEYDNAGDRMSYIGYDVAGVIYIWEEFEYDSAGNWTKVTDCRTGQWTEREYITITPH